MTPYKCPNADCIGDVVDLIFHEPIVNSQLIDSKTGEIRSENEPSDEQAPFFECRFCGTIVTGDGADDEGHDHFQAILDQWLAVSEKLKAERQQKRRARQERARQRTKMMLDSLREEYRQESGFLPPMPRKGQNRP